jgi:methyltransferase (TIGR00027 family)
MMEPSRSLAPVSETALGMALIRAEESLRPDCLFDDPYAEAFLAAAPDAFADRDGATTDPAVLESVFSVFRFQGVIRTRFFDDQLLAGCASGCRQVVLLAAGLDTRAFRLAWPPGVRVFELDLPEVLTFKDHVLAGRRASPRCERTTVPADLVQDWPSRLAAAGFEPTKPTAWLAEGLLVYLSARVVARLLTLIGDRSAPQSRLFFDHGDVADSFLLAQAGTMPGMEQFSALWKGGLGADVPKRLTQGGWDVTTHDLKAVAEPHTRAAPDHARGEFITAVRNDRTPTRRGREANTAASHMHRRCRWVLASILRRDWRRS